MRKVLLLAFGLVLLAVPAMAQEDPAPVTEVTQEHIGDFPPYGSISFTEIPALDPAAASEFYAKMFGWYIEADEEAGMWFFTDPQGSFGAFYQAEAKSAPNSYTVYFIVEDVSAKLVEIEEAGRAMILEETVLPEDWGKIGLFMDLTGNVFGLWSPY